MKGVLCSVHITREPGGHSPYVKDAHMDEILESPLVRFVRSFVNNCCFGVLCGDLGAELFGGL